VILLSIVLACAVTGITRAPQDKPDFFGHWVLAEASGLSTDVPRALTVRLTVTRTSMRGDSMTPFYSEIAIDREFETTTRTESQRIGIVGGTVSGIAGSGAVGRKTLHSVTWDRDELVFESGIYTGDAPDMRVWTERRETWSLDPDGRLGVAVTTRGSAQPPRSVSATYRKRD
jgi:hypothetical protein